MRFRYQIAATILIGCIHGAILAANDRTRQLLDLPTRHRTHPKGRHR